MRPLPDVMVAPNEARRTRQDHPALPITIEEIVQCAVDCHDNAARVSELIAHLQKTGS